MPVNDELGKRMKEYYEHIPKTKLMRRTPVAIRIDGKAFHTFTRGFQRPFDEVLIKSMQDTMKYLCENIQGCVFGYTQSDEITLILVDYKKLNSAAWFDYEVQKMCSIAASMATMAFNEIFLDNVELANKKEFYKRGLDQGGTLSEIKKFDSEFDIYYSKVNKAMFDARCFNIPKEEVANLLYWRQLDATRNSIQMVGQANFSHKELQNKTCNMIQDMLHEQRGINWNDFPTHLKRGSCCIKEKYQAENVDIKDGSCIRTRWVIDKEIPIFKGEDRQYIDRFVWIGER